MKMDKKTIWAGLAAGVLGHILQGLAAFFLFDRFYLENPDLIRDSSLLVAVYYLFLNLIVGLVIAYLARTLMTIWHDPDWKVGLKTGLLVWLASSPVFIIKRQIMLQLSNWLLFEIVTDFVIYAAMGATAGFLIGRGIIQKEHDS
jgi:fluoride ion exporter CrcB/FEX